MNEIINEMTMTVKEIADIFKCSENTILNVIRELFPDIIQNGKTTYINEIQATAIKLQIQKHHNLANICEVEPTDLEMLLLQKKLDKWKDDKINKLQKEVEILKPKALFFDTVADSKTAIEMSTVAKTINFGYGRNELFEILRNEKILMSNNIPYQKYIDLEYFRVIEQKYNKPDGSICVNTKTLVYQKGIDFIIKLLKG